MKIFILLSAILLVTACSTMILRPVDFSWPVESVLQVNSKGVITEERHTLEINVKPIFYEEFNDTNSVEGKQLRLICDRYGSYYFTGAGFKNVYRFIPLEGGMKLIDKINISDSLALKTPAFNQKLNNIELIDGLNKYVIKGSEIERMK